MVHRASVFDKSTRTDGTFSRADFTYDHEGSPDPTAVTVRFGAGAQDANVFITFDAADRHTMQARASLHRD